MDDFSRKQLIVFDLDETLSESKMPIDEAMALLLGDLLRKKKVAVISGGRQIQIETQLILPLAQFSHLFKNLSIFPTCGASFCSFKDTGWELVYDNIFSAEEKREVFKAFDGALMASGFEPSEILYGELIEDRGAQITFSAFGQQAPIEVKGGWDPDLKKREEIMRELTCLIPQFEIRAGGASSIDVTKKGIDKAYGILQMEKHLFVPIEEMLYVGDRLYPGGNDYPVKLLGVQCIAVKGLEDTKELIKKILESSL